VTISNFCNDNTHVTTSEDGFSDTAAAIAIIQQSLVQQFLKKVATATALWL